MVARTLVFLALTAPITVAFFIPPQPHAAKVPSLVASAIRAPTADLVASSAQGPAKAGAAAFTLYAFGFAALLVKTLRAFPLIPPSPNSLLWCRTWLFTTVADYYGAALALCAVIVATEPKMMLKISWSFGVLLQLY